ncbi:MAG TPA: hypothetical protein VL856_15140 [Acidimicrobiia bacterium]|nr:hypothetical protein [Acidimicrobiia bacterium]
MGYCEECGSALDPVARNCVRCGAPAPVTVGGGEAAALGNIPLEPVLPPWLRRPWFVLSGLVLIVVAAAGVFTFERARSDRPRRPLESALASKPVTSTDYANGAGITYHAANGDYSVALPNAPTTFVDSARVDFADATIIVSDRDLGAAVEREPLARVKQVRDIATLAAGSDVSALHVAVDHGALTLDWGTSTSSWGGKENKTSFEQDRAVLVGSHFFLLTLEDTMANDAAFKRLVDSFTPNPALSSF